MPLVPLVRQDRRVQAVEVEPWACLAHLGGWEVWVEQAPPETQVLRALWAPLEATVGCFRVPVEAQALWVPLVRSGLRVRAVQQALQELWERRPRRELQERQELWEPQGRSVCQVLRARPGQTESLVLRV